LYSDLTHTLARYHSDLSETEQPMLKAAWRGFNIRNPREGVAVKLLTNWRFEWLLTVYPRAQCPALLSGSLTLGRIYPPKIMRIQSAASVYGYAPTLDLYPQKCPAHIVPWAGKA
jgi:hypothetical protein